jgi:hypothetical protein
LLPIGDKDDSNIIVASGDGGTGKTSFLQSIYYTLGGTFSIPIEKFVNIDSGKLNTSVEFEYNGDSYKVRTTPTQFILEKLREDEKWVKETSPKSLINLIFKKAQLPSNLYESDGKKQVEWFLELFEMPKEDRATIKAIEDQISEMAKVKRPEIGRELKKATAIVEENIHWQNYQNDNENLHNSILQLKNKIDNAPNLTELSFKVSQHNQALARLESLESEKINKENLIKEFEKQIEEIKLKIELSNNKLLVIEDSILAGNKFIEETKINLEKYENALFEQNKIVENSKIIEAYDKLIIDVEKVNTYETAYGDIDSQIVNAKMQLKDYKATLLPRVEGLTVITDEFNEENKKIGLYIGETQMNQVNESKFMEMVIKSMAIAGAKFIFIENLSSYGTEAILYLQNLALSIKENGGWIFATEMDRAKEKLQIKFAKEIS